MSGTPVLTEDGLAAIEDVCAGDMVWAADPVSGEVALKTVVQTFVNETQELVHIHVNGEEIVCTPEHPFYSPVLGWTAAIQLRAGDILILVNGEYVVVEQIQHEILEAPIEVYNFEVEGFHTYYVGTGGVLVHNKCSMAAEAHHILSNKNKTYTPQFEAIVSQYNLSLNDSWNIISLAGHHGRHTNAYHKLMLTELQGIHAIAQGNPEIFMREFGKVIALFDTNPRLPYIRG